jgi:hypothetical protein
VHGIRQTSSSVDGIADRGANAGRDGRACEKKEEGRSAASQAEGGSGCGGATWCGGGVGPSLDWWAVPRPRPGRLRPGRGAHGRRVSVPDRGAPGQLTGGPRWQWEREGEEMRERREGARGPAREEKRVVEPR